MSLLKAKDSQFRLQDDGSVCYQAQESNPLPGEPIAQLVKGERALKPAVSLLSADVLKGLEEKDVQARLEEWLSNHLKSVLESLVALGDVPESDPEPVKGIAAQVYEAMGIIPRERLESLIAELDSDMRGILRAKRIRLGPILAFIPALNKPAAVRLRALLWGLYNDRDLPMDLPKEGIVSFEVDPAAVDKGYYQSIGYPVFGGRAIRIDMLDRVISAVYDSADKGVFRAQHKMAEWLGCPIDGLYNVLEAMGHTKIEDAPAKENDKSSEDAPKVEALEEAASAVVEEKAEEVKQEEVKPELALFRLKRGKAFQKGGGKRPFKGKAQQKDGQGDKPKLKKKKGGKREDRGPRVISTGPEKKIEDSPFAILEQLKK